MSQKAIKKYAKDIIRKLNLETTSESVVEVKSAALSLNKKIFEMLSEELTRKHIQFLQLGQDVDEINPLKQRPNGISKKDFKDFTRRTRTKDFLKKFASDIVNTGTQLLKLDLSNWA